MRMRSLSLLLLSALCCFPASGFAASVGYSLNTKPGSFYLSIKEACDVYLPEVGDKNGAFFTEYRNGYISSSYSSNTCIYFAMEGTRVRYSLGTFTSDGKVVQFAEYQCEKDKPSTLTWPRYLVDINDVEIPGTAVPLFVDPVCLNGCKAVSQAAVDDCFYDGSNFLFCNFPVKNTQEVCSVSTVAPSTSGDCPGGYEVVGGKCKLLPPVDPCATDPNATGCLPPLDPCIADPNGAGCSGSGTDPGTGTGTDPGTGTGTGTGTDPGTGTGTGTDPGTGTGTGEPTHAASGLGCEQTFACSGDSITCSIAALNKKQLCEGQKGLDKGSPDAKQAMAEAFQSTHENIEETEIHLDSIIANATNSRFLPSSCPPAQTFTVYGRQFAFKNDYFCNFATAMSWLVVSLAGLFAAVYIGKAFGGS
jgi:hypothetical protein